MPIKRLVTPAFETTADIRTFCHNGTWRSDIAGQNHDGPKRRLMFM